MIPHIRKHSWFTVPFSLSAFLLLAYLPLSSFQFALKNDAFLYNFPNKFFFSEALRNGIVPTWNPYLNFGFPIYADPGFAWWHPLTWVFGLIGYNAYTFTIEVLCYIFIAGWGMYQLCRTLCLFQGTSFVAAAMFMCCGFFVGNMQHTNFLTCAAFLPWLICCWIKLQQAPGPRTLLPAALAGYLLFTGGHPAIPIGTVYFFATFAFAYYWHNRKSTNWKRTARWNVAFCLLLIILLMPPLWSWLKLMPFYSRNTEVAQANQTNIGFTLQCLISFVTPLPTAKASSFFQTDVAMRNAYCSLPALLLFILVLRTGKTPAVYKALMTAGLTGFVLALGGPLKQTIFSSLPLLGYIRSNGQYRIFFLLPFIVVAAYGLDKLLQQDGDLISRIKKITLPLMWAAGIAALLCTFFAYTQKPNLPFEKGTTAKQISNLLQPEMFVAAGLIWVTCTAAMLYRWTNTRKLATLVFIFLIDLLLHTWAMLPITGVGQTSVRRMQQIYDHAPKGFSMPGHADKNSYNPTADERVLIGDWSWFDKTLFKDSLISYPSGLKHRPDEASALYDRELQFCHLKQQSGSCNLIYFDPTKLSLDIWSTQNDSLIILQNYYPGWHASTGGKAVKAAMSPEGLLMFPIIKGKSRIDVFFRPF